MRVQKIRDDSGLQFFLFDGEGLEVTAVSDFGNNIVDAPSTGLKKLIILISGVFSHYLPFR